ncbi:MAG: Holliday junction DNA helicase RuvA [Desulfamplus sp.]|nr:Holliday junction DNA helicase RuvA [Desulfamplus sp.]
MIAYMEGKILKAEQDRILLLAGHVGYEILLPVFVIEKVTASALSEQTISLYIYYYQTERQPKPILIGFNSEDEKNFFQIFISVDAIGPLKAVKAMEKPVSQIAMAIEQQDIDFLAGLKGIGKRTAQKIVAALHGKVSQFISQSFDESERYKAHSEASVTSSENLAMDSKDFVMDSKNFAQNQPLSSKGYIISPVMTKISQQVIDVLVDQLGYTGAIAKKMVSMAMEKNASISTPEQLFDAVLHGKQT